MAVVVTDLDALIVYACTAGWRVARLESGHRVLHAPGNEVSVTAPAVPSDRAAMREFRTALGAAGLDVYETDAGSAMSGGVAASPAAGPAPAAADPMLARRRRTRDNAKILAQAPKLTSRVRGRQYETKEAPLDSTGALATAEEAVRRYLAYLEDPRSARDPEAIAEAEKAVAAATDPIKKVLALASLRRLDDPDPGPLEADFVAHAPEWAASVEVTADDFAAFGVPAPVLVAAGVPARSAPTTPSSRRRRQSSTTTKRKQRVPTRLDHDRDVLPVVAALTGEWKLTDLAAALQRDPQRARSVLRRLLDEGVVEEVGLDNTGTGPGRAAKLYRSQP